MIDSKLMARMAQLRDQAGTPAYSEEFKSFLLELINLTPDTYEATDSDRALVWKFFKTPDTSGDELLPPAVQAILALRTVVVTWKLTLDFRSPEFIQFSKKYGHLLIHDGIPPS